MLQFPTNVYPQNVAFDPTVADDNNDLKFMFNGDILTSISWKICDYATGEEVENAHRVNGARLPLGYNGDYMGYIQQGHFGENLEVGHDYVMQMMFTQSTTNGSENVCDMPVVRGTVKAHNTSTSFYIADKIPNIYEWDSNNVKTPTRYNDLDFAQMNIEVAIENNGEIITESRKIASYNYNTGEVTIATPFSYPPLAGYRYIIYSNYLVTPQYYFMCRTNPTNALTLSNTNYGVLATINVEGDYFQLEGVMIKSWHMELSWFRNDIAVDSVGWRLLATTPEIYSQRVSWKFYNPFMGYNTIDKTYGLSHQYYRVKCVVVTQDGVELETYAKINLSSILTEIVSPSGITFAELNADAPDYKPETSLAAHHALQINVAFSADVPDNSSDIIHTLYRRNKETGEVSFVQSAWTRQGARLEKFTDYFVPCKGDFEYIYVARQKNGTPYINCTAHADYATAMEGYSITALIPHYDQNYGTHPYDIQFYDIGECWKFVGDIQDTTVTQNIDRVSHVGHGKYSAVSSGNPNYSSGTVSAMMGYVDCVGKKFVDTVDMVRAWRKFITQNAIFLLKSPKGDVWVINIVEAPTTTYDESNTARPTTFTFTWAECCDISDINLNMSF